MRSEMENHYLLKAVEAFRRRLIVISPDFKILAANFGLESGEEEKVIGHLCHQIFYDRPDPCVNCAVQKAKETGRPALQPKTVANAPNWINSPASTPIRSTPMGKLRPL